MMKLPRQSEKIERTLREKSALCLVCFLVVGSLADEGAPLDSVDLSGTWNFTPAGKSQTTITVPGGGWYKQGFTNISEAVYSRTIAIPNSGQPQVTKIEFGVVNYQAALSINNQLVATNLTAWTPSVFDISKFVTPGQSYTLQVDVKGRNAFTVNGKSTVPTAAGWSPNLPDGIFRSAFLKVYPQIYISDCYVRTSVTNASLAFDVWVTNAGNTAQNLSLSAALSSWNQSNFAYPSIPSQTFTVNPNATMKITFGPIAWGLGASSYWWPNVPYQTGYTAQLHNLTLTLMQNAAAVNTKTVRFGFREVDQKSSGGFTDYFLNGIRVNFRGDNLQGVNYDAINYGGGRGDAYDTYPGFGSGANGWPQVVDNYQRLNFNFVRLHQEPVAPYMLDVCDEKGLMVMVESAIRGSEGNEDFTNGHNNMVNHLIALIDRDRNHPAVVRWSQSNEPGGTDQFEIDLYNAAMSADSTRPISVDGTTFNNLKYPNFSTFIHYGNGLGNYTEAVGTRTDQPFGQGEFVWPMDETLQGFMWFATSAQAMRRQNASDIRPYTLLSAWASLVPGVRRTDMELEQGYKNYTSWNGVTLSPNPIYGTDNLPNPWSNPIIERIQAAYNPVLVADSGFWESNKMSDAKGDWPYVKPTVLNIGQMVTRNLTVYNDEFSGTAVDVSWQLRNSSPTGPVIDSGSLHPSIPLGSHVTTQISFTPAKSSDSVAYLVLISKKDSVERFQETAEKFLFSSFTPVLLPKPPALAASGKRMLNVLGQNLWLPEEFQGKDIVIDLVDMQGHVVHRLQYSPAQSRPEGTPLSLGVGVFFARCTAGTAQVTRLLAFVK